MTDQVGCSLVLSMLILYLGIKLELHQSRISQDCGECFVAMEKHNVGNLPDVMKIVVKHLEIFQVNPDPPDELNTHSTTVIVIS